MTLENYVSEQFVGKDKDLAKIQEDIFQTIKEGWNEKLGYVPLKPMALITVHNPKSSIIESIGFSKPNDLLTNIFGAAFAGMWNAGGNVLKNLTDINGIVNTVVMKLANSNGYNRTSSPSNVGMRMKVGQGGAIARSDFQLTTPFVAAPESNLFNITPGGWISGNQQVIVSGLLASVTTSDVIGECGLFAKWRTNTAPNFNSDFMISHDVASASFSGGQNINVTYTWSIS